MSHSQFQSRWFILRLAWLNLWDERMTTGRINQVAILYANGLNSVPSSNKLRNKPYHNPCIQKPICSHDSNQASAPRIQVSLTLKNFFQPCALDVATVNSLDSGSSPMQWPATSRDSVKVYFPTKLFFCFALKYPQQVQSARRSSYSTVQAPHHSGIGLALIERSFIGANKDLSPRHCVYHGLHDFYSTKCFAIHVSIA